METFVIKLSVAVIPLVVLVASVVIHSKLSSWHIRRPLAWHRTRRHVLRAMASGVMIR